MGAVEQELKGVTPAQIVEQAEAFSAARSTLLVDPLADDEDNRRAFQRLPAAFSIELEPEHRTGRSDLTTLPLNGVTLNVSKGGMLAKIDQGILRHGHYLIRFLKAGSSVSPEITWGPYEDHGRATVDGKSASSSTTRWTGSSKASRVDFLPPSLVLICNRSPLCVVASP